MRSKLEKQMKGDQSDSDVLTGLFLSHLSAMASVLWEGDTSFRLWVSVATVQG